MQITLGQQYNVGEKPTVILYIYINRHVGTPKKTLKTKDICCSDRIVNSSAELDSRVVKGHSMLLMFTRFALDFNPSPSLNRKFIDVFRFFIHSSKTLLNKYPPGTVQYD